MPELRNAEKAVARVVWAVSSGSYSDYRVHFACPDKKTAEALVKHLNGREKYGEYGVEELPVYDAIEAVTPKHNFIVEVDIDGVEKNRYESTFNPWEGEHHLTGWVPYPRFARGVSDRSFEVALKSARDHAAKQRAKKARIA